MKIDYEYISEILNVFISSPKPNVDINDFQKLWHQNENSFYFHVLILQDKGVIVGSGRDPFEIGIRFNGNIDDYTISVVPWRLSAEGHEFASALSKPPIKSLILNKFKDEGLSAVIDVAKKLVMKRSEKLLEDALK